MMSRKIIGTLLLFLIVLSIYTLLATSVGLKAIITLTQRFVPELIITQAEGSILGPMTLHNVHYQDDSVNIIIPAVNFDWRPLALLQGRLHIVNLQINDSIIEVNTAASTKPTIKKQPLNLNWLERVWIDQLQINNGWIKPGDIRLQVKGSLVKQLDLHWQIIADEKRQIVLTSNKKATQVEHVLRTLRGKLAVNGIVDGERLQPHIQANIQANQFSFEDFSADKLQINIDTNLMPNTNSLLQFNGTDLRYGDYYFMALNAQAQGKLAPKFDVVWTLSAKFDPKSDYKGAVTAKGSVGGSFAEPNFDATILGKQIQTAALMIGRLQAQLHGDLAKDSNSQLQLQLLNMRTQQYDFAPIKLQAILDRKQQTLDVQLSGSQLRYPANDQIRALRWQNSHFQAAVQDDDLVLQGRLPLSQQYLNLNLRLPDYKPVAMPKDNQPIRGNIEVVIQDVGPFLGAVNDVQNIKGSVRANIQINGTYGKPQLLGSLNLNNGSAYVPALNLKIRDIQIAAQGNQDSVVNWQGSLRSGTGVLNIKGITQLNQKDLATTLALTGQNITASNTTQYQIIISPDAKIVYENKELTFKGLIKIPKANINIGSGDNAAIELSNDVVFVHEHKKIPTNTLPINAQLQLQLGKEVRLQYQGLNTKLSGQVLLVDSPSQPTKGTGQIKLIDGEYRYYGQVLTINKNSHVIFNGGDVSNPTLAIQAIRVVTASPTATPATAGDISTQSTELSTSAAQLPGQATKITVGINVQGSADNPQLTLFSQPPGLSQTDILSYLVTGQPSNQLGAGGASLLFNAVSSLNAGGGGTSQLKNITKEIQQTLGLSELSVQSSPIATPGQAGEQGTAVVLGKALSPKLYINYSVGLLDALSAFQARYQLSKYWTLQSTTTTVGSGIDMLYTIERGK